jgi:hypothetical protein
MIGGLISRIAVATVATAAGLGLYATGVGLSVPSGSGLQMPMASCLGTVGIAADSPETAPSPSCDSEKQQCMSASVQEGIYGERYVPPDAVAMCMEAYRDCTNASS